MIYWTSGDWVGIGPGAHGRLTKREGRFATETHRMPLEWLSGVEIKGSGEIAHQYVSPSEALEEAIMMGLRLDIGIEISYLSSNLLPKFNMLINGGLIECSDEKFRTTAKGRPVLNYILRELLT